MALEKVITYDYEVRGVFKHIQERQKTTIMEDGNELSSSYHRNSFAPDADISGESDELKGMASALWSDEVKAAWFVFQHKYPSGDPSDSWELAQLQKYCDDNDIEHYPEAVEAVEAQDAVLDEDGEEVSPAVEAVEAQDADTKASLLAAIEEASDE
jgi:hypothetical protein